MDGTIRKLGRQFSQGMCWVLGYMAAHLWDLG